MNDNEKTATTEPETSAGPHWTFSVMHAASPARQRFASRLVAEVSLAAPAWRDPRPFDTEKSQYGQIAEQKGI